MAVDLEDAASDAVGPPKEGQQAYCLDTEPPKSVKPKNGNGSSLPVPFWGLKVRIPFSEKPALPAGPCGPADS